MRDFSVTAEPKGAKSKPGLGREEKALPFVVQKHAATRLHYDFRLGLNGVLKSWAVTKGPSYYPGDKRLAVQVEDHPWEYAGFEGTIPKGQYGGGTVMVWDKGEWIPHGDAEQGLRDGELKFELRGKKLKGNWVLVRMNGRAGGPNKTNWLLIKERDKFARESSAPAITDEAPDSAVSGRTMDEIAESRDRVWNSARGTEDGGRSATHKKNSEPASVSAPPEKKRTMPAPDLKQIPRERFPGFIAPQLAQQTASAPRGEGWVHELKLDGYRIQILIRSDDKKAAKNRTAKLLTRKGLDWTARMPDIADAAAKLNVESAILDGEAVALDKRGVSNFADLQAAFHEGRQRYITYFAFDLLHLNGHNLRGLPLEDRKRILADLLRDAGGKSPLKLSEDIEVDGNEVFKKACALGAEGIVSKLKSAKYTSGRSGAWLKLKCRLEQEFVIGGFTLPSKGGSGIGALLLGYYEKGKLRYAGRAGTGFTQETHQMIRARLDRLQQKNSSFAEVPLGERRSAIWVKPELVAEIAFSTWTRDNLVRQAAFKGLREDKPASEVVRETAVVPAEVGPTKAEHSSPAPKNAKSNNRRQVKEAAGMKELAITHPDKVLDPESRVTKQQLAEYYMAVAEHMLPHIADRPISVVRCPDGIGKACFFQKHVGMGLPAGVKTISIRNKKSKESEAYLTVDSSAGLLGLAQMGVLEIHPWGSHNESLDTPDRIVFDLDPDMAIGWKTLAKTAVDLKARLKKVGLESFVKSTGGKGLHVVVPIRSDHEWPAVKDFAHRMALELERENPELYVTKMTKAVRKNRIYLDYLRNDREATSVAPFSPRARPGMPVAMPLAWKELESAKAPAFHVSDFHKWQTRLRRDPWRKLLESKQKLKV